MKTPNANGVYEAEYREELARLGRSYAAVEISQCRDGLYRYRLDCMFKNSGFCGPITDRDEGFATLPAAKEAGTQELLERFPTAWPSEPQSVHDELRLMKAQVEQYFRQPTLF